MSERKLASICTVKAIDDIAGKDRIGLISFAEVGWKVIATKTLSIGEKVVYVELDSILPAPFLDKMKESTMLALKKRSWNELFQGCRIKCMKMSGVMSYGILFTREELGTNVSDKDWEKYKPMADLTKALGIQKVEEEPSAMAYHKKSKLQAFIDKILWKVFKIKQGERRSYRFPVFINKTDETRIQAFPPEMFEALSGKEFYSTVKIDGQSVTFALHKGEFYICSRGSAVYREKIKRAMKEITPNAYGAAHFIGNNWIRSACKYNIAAAMYRMSKTNRVSKEQYGDHYIQCEQAGPGIQSNRLKLPQIELYVFNVYSFGMSGYFSWEDLTHYTTRLNGSPLTMKRAEGVKTVPLIERIKFAFDNVEQIEKYAEGTYESGYPREGVVFRADVPSGTIMPHPMQGMSNMMSFKCINPSFLLKTED